jgi:hypothetical protein
MYKIFHNNIKHFSLVIGYLNLLRSFYYGASNGNVEDQSYLTADHAITMFKSFCKDAIKEIEKLLINQEAQVKFDLTILTKINELVNSIPKPASEGIKDEIAENIGKVNKFIHFLTNEFAHKIISQVDLRTIQTEINVFKYQTYLS